MQHYFDTQHEPGKREEGTYRALCGADMRTVDDGKKCPKCAEKVRKLGLSNNEIDGGAFVPQLHPRG